MKPVADAQGALPLPWLAEPLALALARQRGHATLVQGAPGIGALEFVLAMAQAFLCEAQPTQAGISMPCGQCGSCKLVQAGLHPDLYVLLPEALRRETGWLLADDKAEGAELKRKPSKQIRVPEVRTLIDWTHNTSARGRGKVAVLHPADTLNYTAASALLKTLEEPPVGTRLLLTAADPQHLLPTVRSRCQNITLPTPTTELAKAWLATHNVADPAVMLAACNQRPLEALARVQVGIDAKAWAALPGAVARGNVAAVSGWPPPMLVDALQKLCHDALAQSVGGPGSYFPPESMPPLSNLQAMLDWSTELAWVARHAEHPWNEPLLADALVQQGRRALQAKASPGQATALGASDANEQSDPNNRNYGNRLHRSDGGRSLASDQGPAFATLQR